MDFSLMYSCYLQIKINQTINKIVRSHIQIKKYMGCVSPSNPKGQNRSLPQKNEAIRQVDQVQNHNSGIPLNQISHHKEKPLQNIEIPQENLLPESKSHLRQAEQLNKSHLREAEPNHEVEYKSNIIKHSSKLNEERISEKEKSQVKKSRLSEDQNDFAAVHERKDATLNETHLNAIQSNEIPPDEHGSAIVATYKSHNDRRSLDVVEEEDVIHDENAGSFHVGIKNILFQVEID